MLKKISINLLICLLFCLNYSCNNSSSKLDFRKEKIEETSDFMCDDACPSVELDLIAVHTKNKVADSINSKIFYTVKELLLIEDKQIVDSSYEQLAKLFLSEYKELKTNFPNDAIGWEAVIKAELTYQSDEILCIRID
ncbi:MAG: hypothetical protein Q4B43_01085, partial [Bacteroidota bacterium]|nr:hypothetical protein [Bacteroidota bacterium]